MIGLRTFLRQCWAPQTVRGWRALPWLVVFAAILIGLPQARALLTAGLLGGVVLGAFLILIRHQAGPRGPRRGTPIVLFPRPVPRVSDLLTRSQVAPVRILA